MRRYLPFLPQTTTVSVVRLQGAIGAGARTGLSDQAVAPILEKAFRRGRPAAVALQINSPGGSPVQSSLIGSRVRQLSEDTGVPVHAFVEDVAASGGYWLAAAADDIWCDPSSILGSIGVIYASFGAHNLISRYGIERRVHTAGRSKSQLDPFRPENPDDVARLERLLAQIHESFVGHVKSRRGDKLKADPDLFTGEIWVGRAAVEIGLADGIGHMMPKLNELYGDKVRLRRYGPRRNLFSRLGATVAEDALAAVEERAAYARFGL